MYKLNTILEVIYSVGDLEKTKGFFCDYGGWDIVGKFQSDESVLKFWNLDSPASAQELLIQFDNHPTGLLRLVKFNGVEQEYIRSSQMAWDTGGIMDINMRVHNVKKSYDELREMGWHGLSDPLFQTIGPFQLHDILMKGYDDIIVAFTHRTQPPLELKEGFKLPTHIYNSSIIVKDLKASQHFYAEVLGFSLLNEYEVKKETPQENMFGVPINISDKMNCKANIFSLDGTRDVVFQILEFEGLVGKDFSEKAIPPNRGLLLYRCEVEGVKNYYEQLLKKDISIHQPLQELIIEPYGKVNCFAIISPDGVWWEFLEKIK